MEARSQICRLEMALGTQVAAHTRFGAVTVLLWGQKVTLIQGPKTLWCQVFSSVLTLQAL